MDLFDGPEGFRDYFKSKYGPTIVAYRSIADDPERVAALDRDLVELASAFQVGGGDASPPPTTRHMEWEYLLLTARKRGLTRRPAEKKLGALALGRCKTGMSRG